MVNGLFARIANGVRNKIYSYREFLINYAVFSVTD